VKIGCTSWSYHRAIEQGRTNMKEWVKLCAEQLNIDGIELLDVHFPSTSNRFIKEIKKMAIDLGLTICCVDVSNNFGIINEHKRTDEIEKVKKWIDIAAKFGAPILRVFAGWPEDEDEESWNRMIDSLTKVSDYAEEIGIVLGLENHNHKGFIKTGDDILRIMEQVNSRWLAFLLDTGNFVDGLRSIEKTAHLAVHVHVRLANLDKGGEEKEILDILNRVKYRGFLSIEYEGEEDELSAVPRRVEFLKDILREYS